MKQINKIIISMVLLILISALFMGCTEQAVDTGLKVTTGHDNKVVGEWNNLVNKGTSIVDKMEMLTNLHKLGSISDDEYLYRYLDACQEYVDICNEGLFFIKYNEKELEASGMNTDDLIKEITEKKHKAEEIILKLRNN